MQNINTTTGSNACTSFLAAQLWSPQLNKSVRKSDITFKFQLRKPWLSRIRFNFHCGSASCDLSHSPSLEPAEREPLQFCWRDFNLHQAKNAGLGLAVILAAIVAYLCRTNARAMKKWSLISQLKWHTTFDVHVPDVQEDELPLEPPQFQFQVQALTSAFSAYGRDENAQQPAYIIQNSLRTLPVHLDGVGKKKRESKFARKMKNISNESLQLASKLNEGQGGIDGANVDSTESWLYELKEEALRRGVKNEVIERAFEGITISEKILEIDQNRPEVKLTVEEYLNRMVTDKRVSKGVKAFRENKALLEEISLKYGVPAPLLVAIWGIESSYGAYTGDWDTIEALITMSYGRQKSEKSKYFREEIFSALAIIEQGHGPPGEKRLQGSYAGAMGQCQFMPSSFLSYAVDYDGDGRTDIWESRADILASIANYLLKHGWKEGHPIAQKVSLGKDIDQSFLGLDVKKSVSEWKNDYQVTVVEGEPEVSPNEIASLIAPDGLQADVYLVYDNFRTIMRYNISVLYSISVNYLTQKIISQSLQE